MKYLAQSFITLNLSAFKTNIGDSKRVANANIRKRINVERNCRSPPRLCSDIDLESILSTTMWNNKCYQN